MSGRGLVHLVTGGTGAGKTVYSIALAKQIGGIRFSIDEWMTRLFWMDTPNPIEFEWTMDRIDRCEAQIRSLVAALAERGIASVLDLGFTKAQHRADFGAFARDISTTPRLHWLDIPREERWQRVLQRNQEKGATYAMDVNQAMFDFMDAEWEAPSAEEMRALNGRIIQS